MKTARFGCPVALVRDRFVLALGGRTSKSTTTKLCEAYDTNTNTWFSIAPLPSSILNATAIVMSERYVYVMPGVNKDCQVGNSLLINMLDSGSSTLYKGDRNSRMYGQAMGSQKWVQLEVANADFVAAKPCSGIQLSSTDMLIFGGDSTKTFAFDTR